MKITQLRSMAAVSALWLALGAGCQKDPPDPCKNGECCWPGETHKFIKRIEGGRAGIAGSGFLFEETISVDGLGSYNGALMCIVQGEEIGRTYKPNLIYVTENGKTRLADSTNMYAYRVWGTVYDLVNIPKLTSAPVYVFRLDRAEKVQ